MTAGELVANGADKVAGWRLGGGFCLDDGQWLERTGGGDFFVLGGNDLVEDVAHALSVAVLGDGSSVSSKTRSTGILMLKVANSMLSPAP